MMTVIPFAARSSENMSLAERLSQLDEKEREIVISSLSDDEAADLVYDWRFHARPKQIKPPGEWFTWLILSGRGFGKTRTGAETIREWVGEAEQSGNYPILLALISETAGDARDVMVEGESGILSCFPPDRRPHYEPSKRRITFYSEDGTTVIASATIFTGQEPEQLRGPQFHKAWVDELAKFQYPQDTWDNLELALRLGLNPQVIVTTTPKPLPLIIELYKDPESVVTSGSSYENMSNLAPKYVRRIIKKYEGTRLGRQELHAEILQDVEGSLWPNEIIESNRRRVTPQLVRITVNIDPAATSVETANETGITATGISETGHGYLLGDWSGIYSPKGWASKAIEIYKTLKADRIVAERNNGGEMVETTIHSVDENVPVKLVWAARGKHVRAEPISSFYEQNRIHHVGTFAILEQQLSFFTNKGYQGGDSPDRAESAIWGFTELMGSNPDYESQEWEDYRK